MPIKNLVYSAAKATGLFPWAQQRARDGLCILCYHGFSFHDEHLFRPKLFLTPDLFRQRMEYLKDAGYAVLPLDEAVERLRRGKLREKELVITMDDGFYSVAALAAPILREAGFTATIYVTTYYVQRKNPIFRLAMQYIFWKTTLSSIDCTDFPIDLTGPQATKGIAGETTVWQLINLGEKLLDENGRMALARDVARRLAVDFDELAASRRLSLMTEAEVADLAGQGFDIQLHTHRHRLPPDSAEASRELRENRAALARLSGRPLNHLCYPSGQWSPEMWPVLAAEGVATATTCDPGRNYASTPLLGLKRFLDFQTIPPIVFEAEVSGFSELVRRFAGRAEAR